MLFIDDILFLDIEIFIIFFGIYFYIVMNEFLFLKEVC